jgi:hypothetical protein
MYMAIIALLKKASNASSPAVRLKLLQRVTGLIQSQMNVLHAEINYDKKKGR